MIGLANKVSPRSASCTSSHCPGGSRSCAVPWSTRGSDATPGLGTSRDLAWRTSGETQPGLPTWPCKEWTLAIITSKSSKTSGREHLRAIYSLPEFQQERPAIGAHSVTQTTLALTAPAHLPSGRPCRCSLEFHIGFCKSVN